MTSRLGQRPLRLSDYRDLAISAYLGAARTEAHARDICLSRPVYVAACSFGSPQFPKLVGLLPGGSVVAMELPAAASYQPDPPGGFYSVGAELWAKSLLVLSLSMMPEADRALSDAIQAGDLPACVASMTMAHFLMARDARSPMLMEGPPSRGKPTSNLMAFAHFALDCSVCVRVNTDRIAAELANACADRKATG